MIRSGAAPTASRIANSPSRAADCALSRPPRFAQQTISRTAATAASMAITRGSRSSSDMPRGWRTTTPLFSPGGACVQAAGMIAANSAAASGTVRPADSRPTIVNVVHSASSESLHHRYPTRSIIVGIYRFTGIGVRATGCAGAMPMTVNATPLIVITEPTAPGLPPNHDCQKSYPMTATRSRSGTRSSSARKKRPSTGRISKSGK